MCISWPSVPLNQSIGVRGRVCWSPWRPSEGRSPASSMSEGRRVRGACRGLPATSLLLRCDQKHQHGSGSTWKHRTPTPTPDLQSQTLYFTGATLAHKHLIISGSHTGCHPGCTLPSPAGRVPPRHRDQNPGVDPAWDSNVQPNPEISQNNQHLLPRLDHNICDKH